jgi:hypothetical protein
MNAEIRLQQANFYQQQLRAEAASQRLASGGQDRIGSPNPTAHGPRIPRTLGALRRFVGNGAA